MSRPTAAPSASASAQRTHVEQPPAGGVPGSQAPLQSVAPSATAQPLRVPADREPADRATAPAVDAVRIAPGPQVPPAFSVNSCTAPQLRRFIKSRPYVPMHELRRRFGILGTDDDVTQVRLASQAIYVGLPEREGALLGDLLRGGEIGCELSLDPRTPVVIGVYPMRPVPRG